MVSVCLPSDALSQHLPSYLGFSYLGRGVSLHGCSSKAQLLLLTLDEGYLLIAPPPDLERGVAPLGPPAPRSHHSLDVGLLLSAAAPDLRRFCRHTYFPFPTQPDHQIRLISFPHFEHGLEGSYNSLSLNPSFEVRETEAYKEQKLVQGDIKNSSSHMDQSLLTYF